MGYLQIFLTSFGGSALLLAIAFFMGKRWVGVRIEESVKHEYSNLLEKHKADLQQEINEHLHNLARTEKQREATLEADRKLYHLLVELLPSDGCMEFVRTNNWDGYSFESKILSPLKTFCFEWDVPEKQFLDPDLEQLRLRLLKSGHDFIGFVAVETFPVPERPGFNSVPDDWETENPKRHKSAVDGIHTRANDVSQAHRELLENARKKLLV